MKSGTIDLILLIVAFLGIQVWWLRMTIKNDGEKVNKEDLLNTAREKLEKSFRLQNKGFLKLE